MLFIQFYWLRCRSSLNFAVWRLSDSYTYPNMITIARVHFRIQSVKPKRLWCHFSAHVSGYLSNHSVVYVKACLKTFHLKACSCCPVISPSELSTFARSQNNSGENNGSYHRRHGIVRSLHQEDVQPDLPAL